MFIEPYTEILGGKADIFIERASAINLTCIVHAPDRPATIFWIHEEKSSKTNNKTFSLKKRIAVGHDYPEERLDLRRSEVEADSTSSQLTLRDARVSDSGVYRCSPSNTSPASVVVHVLDGEYNEHRLASALGF